MNCKHRSQFGWCEIRAKRKTYCGIWQYAFCEYGALPVTLVVIALLLVIAGLQYYL